jgi:hypothetical protein
LRKVGDILELDVKLRCQKLRVSICKTKIRPIVTCGAELWTLKNKMETAVIKWERKILRTKQGLI